MSGMRKKYLIPGAASARK